MSIISPDLLHVLDGRAEPRNSWEGYADLLRYMQAALLRIPELEELDALDIDRCFTNEMHYLAMLVDDLFSAEGIEELASYLSDPLPLQGDGSRSRSSLTQIAGTPCETLRSSPQF